LGRTGELVTLKSVDEFWSDNKIVDSKLKALRQSVMKEWSQAAWEGFLLRANPETADKFQAKFDEELKKKKKKKTKPKLADFLEYTEYTEAGSPNVEEEVLAKDEKVPGADGDTTGRGVSKETRTRLRGFLDTVPAQSPEEIEAAKVKDPKVKLVEVKLSKSDGGASNKGGIVVKKATASSSTSSSRRKGRSRRGKKASSRSRTGR